MSNVLQVTYHDGNLVLDEKLDAALEGQKLTLILVEECRALDHPNQTEVEPEERKQGRQAFCSSRRFTCSPLCSRFVLRRMHQYPLEIHSRRVIRQ